MMGTGVEKNGKRKTGAERKRRMPLKGKSWCNPRRGGSVVEKIWEVKKKK